MKKTIALVGATGKLGGLILQRLLYEDVAVRVLLREGSEGKIDLPNREAEFVKGDLISSSDAVLDELTKDCFAVISSVQGGADVIVDGQLKLFRSASSNGIRRFIPSDYSFDHFKLEKGENFNSDFRREFAHRAAAENSGTQLVHILNGVFIDVGVLFGFLGAIDLQNGTVQVWGDGQQQFDLTTYQDTAAYTSKAAVAEKLIPERLMVAGDQKTIFEIREAFERITGKTLSVRHGGSLDDMRQLIQQRLQADPQNFYGYLPLMYYLPMLSGKARLSELHNHLFPGIKPTTIEEFIANTFT